MAALHPSCGEASTKSDASCSVTLVLVLVPVPVPEPEPVPVPVPCSTPALVPRVRRGRWKFRDPREYTVLCWRMTTAVRSSPPPELSHASSLTPLKQISDGRPRLPRDALVVRWDGWDRLAVDLPRRDWTWTRHHPTMTASTEIATMTSDEGTGWRGRRWFFRGLWPPTRAGCVECGCIRERATRSTMRMQQARFEDPRQHVAKAEWRWWWWWR